MGNFDNGNKLAGWCRFIVWAVGVVLIIASAFFSMRFQVAANATGIEVLHNVKLDKSVYGIERDSLRRELDEMKTQLKEIKNSQDQMLRILTRRD